MRLFWATSVSASNSMTELMGDAQMGHYKSNKLCPLYEQTYSKTAKVRRTPSVCSFNLHNMPAEIDATRVGLC